MAEFLLAPSVDAVSDWTSLLVPLGGGGIGVGICFIIARQLWKLYTEGLREENARLRKDFEAERIAHNATKEERKTDLKTLYQTQVENAHLRVMLAAHGQPTVIIPIPPPIQLEPPDDTTST